MSRIELINGDCREIFPEIAKKEKKVIVVTDPPFNIGYKYNEYKDNMAQDKYLDMLGGVFSKYPSVVIHYPEELYRIAFKIGKIPERVVSWVYNSNTAKQHRDVAFFDIKPDFSKVRQPYKNPNDKRIKERIANGAKGAKLYDWWNVNQVKNISKDKTAHPCQMPIEVMENIIGILPDDATIIDCFTGSGTTGLACKHLNRDFIGIELNKEYLDIARERIERG